MTEIATFWNQEHPLSEQAQELFEKLVPMSGSCTTLQGELLRASTRIGYDWYNNGWGCNNWSGAVVFLREHLSDLPNKPEPKVIFEFLKRLDYVHDYSHGEPCHFVYDGPNCEAVTKIHEIVVNAILANPDPIPTTLDMFDFQEGDYIGDEDFDDDHNEDGE
jgi:hypothetical protein